MIVSDMLICVMIAMVVQYFITWLLKDEYCLNNLDRDVTNDEVIYAVRDKLGEHENKYKTIVDGLNKQLKMLGDEQLKVNKRLKKIEGK